MNDDIDRATIRLTKLPEEEQAMLRQAKETWIQEIIDNGELTKA